MAMTAPDLPNSPEREAWCKAERIRALIRTRENLLKQTEELLRQDRQQLAEALCPFKVGDVLVPKTEREWPKFEITAVIPDVRGDYSILGTLSFGSGSMTQTGYTRGYVAEYLRKLAPPPEDPRVEAVAAVIRGRFPQYDDYTARSVAVEALAAADVVRAESRARAQERRLEAVAEEIFNIEKEETGRHDCWAVLWNGGKGKYRGEGRRILAAADAAEGGR